MYRSHKIRLYPNNKQETYFKKACGTARFTYNWALEKWLEKRKSNEYISESELRRELNAIKKQKYPWMMDVTKCAPQLAIKNDLHNAIQNYEENRTEKPKFHKKGEHDSFSISNDQFTINGKYVRIPKNGWVRLAEEPRYQGKIIGAAVSRKADKWFIAIQYELPDVNQATICDNQAIGVDLGVKAFAVLSDGIVIIGAKAWKHNEQKLRRLNKELSRRQGAKKDEKKSHNFIKTKNKIARLYAKMADIRTDGTHKLTTMLIKKYSLIGIEDLNVSGMMKNHKLAKSIADKSFFEFRRQLCYKAIPAKTKIVVAKTNYASSKICNVCGEKNNDLTLAIREWTCNICNTCHDRDVNAAINLRNYAIINQ